MPARFAKSKALSGVLAVKYYIMKKRVIIAGSGGQGILFFGRLLAYAAMLDGREVTCFPSYGAEVRGGTANCTVIISDSVIGSPVIRNPDILVVLNDASYNRFLQKLSSGGILVYDSSVINSTIHREDIKVIKVPANDILSSFNGSKAANMAMLGAFISATGIVGIDSALQALDEITPPRRRVSLDVNKAIIVKGYSSLYAMPLNAPEGEFKG